MDVDPKSIRSHLETVERIAREASIDTRKSIAELRSESDESLALDDILLEAVAKFSCGNSTVVTTNIDSTLPRFSHEICHEIGRIVEEALANVRRHSGARGAFLTARTTGKALLMEVRDDGKGFQQKDAMAGHFGITGMKERARRINGKFQVNSGFGEGTQIVLEVPLRAKWNAKGALRR